MPFYAVNVCDTESVFKVHPVDKNDVEKLAREYYDRLFRAALFVCNEPEMAEDLVQETFLAAADAIDKFEGRSSLYTWLYGIFLNKFRTRLRKKKSQKKISLQRRAEELDMSNIGEMLQSNTPETTEILQQRERAEAVREAIDELPPHHKDVLILRYVEDMSYEKISGALDCSIGTVKSRIHYALNKISEKLKNHPSIKGEP